MTGTCPACGTQIEVTQADTPGSRLTCTACGASLEVLAAQPLQLDWAFDPPVGRAEPDSAGLADRTQW